MFSERGSLQPLYELLSDCSIQALLSAPNPDDPLSENIAKHWKANEAEAVETGNVGNFLFVKKEKKRKYFDETIDIISPLATL